MKATAGRVLRVLIVASLVGVSDQLFCGSCPALFRRACCALSPPNCCPAKAGLCTTPIPDIPQQGINAVRCSGDSSCGGTNKCCPIRQASTGQFFSICQAPRTAAAATKAGLCTTPIPDIPQQGINAVRCSGDSSCGGTNKCCPIRQASTGQFFAICQAPSTAAAASTASAATTPAPTVAPTVTTTTP